MAIRETLAGWLMRSDPPWLLTGVDRQEAGAIADAIVAELQAIPYAALTERLLGEVETRELTGPSGVTYQVEIQGMWDTGKPGRLLVIVGVDDGTLRGAFRPEDRSFLVG